MFQEKKPLSPKTKKFVIYLGMAVVGLGLVYLMTAQTEKAPARRDPEAISLTGNADTSQVSIEALARRLSAVETEESSRTSELRNDVIQLKSQVTSLTKALEREREEQHEKTQLAIERALADFNSVGQQNVEVQGQPEQEQPALAPDSASKETQQRPTRENRVTSLYEPSKQAVQPQPQQVPTTPAPKIVVYGAEKPEPEEESFIDQLPDVQIPAGSIVSAILLTGLDAPTGTRAASQPVPVLMRIKKEAILPNYALADVEDCHLLGGAYGDLGSLRVNIRGEVVSCILRDKSAVEGSVKFFVTGEDGKNGIRGRLVSRAGRVLAAASAAALTQGLLASLDETSAENIVLGGADSYSGAISGASQGFDLLTEYYLDLAEKTFPVIEITNDRWVDVVLTEMLTIKWKG